jgi:hypothetical protein
VAAFKNKLRTVKRTRLQCEMSAYGPKQTRANMSAFGGKADMVFCGISLSRSLLG